MALELNGTTGVSLVQDGVVATADLADGAVTAAKINSAVGLGITMVDSWRLNSTVSCASNVEVFITSNLEQNDSANAGFIGTGMTESSGVFTFPSTGIYQILHMQTYYGTNTGSRALENTILLSTDSGSSYSVISLTYGGITNKANDNANFGQVVGNTYIDVTNASTFRVKFRARSYGDLATLSGDSARDQTTMQFIRLGDT